MKNDKIYCVFCGEENDLKKTRCISCDKKLNSKENMLVDYIIGHVKDDLKGKAEEGVISLITSFIKSHLYGVIMTMSILITGTTLIVNAVSSNEGFEIVTEPPKEVVNDYIGEGLGPEELLELYVDLLQDGRDELAQSMHVYEYNATLESFPLYRQRDVFFEVYDDEVPNISNRDYDYEAGYAFPYLHFAYNDSITFNIMFGLSYIDGNWYISGENIYYDPLILESDPNYELDESFREVSS